MITSTISSLFYLVLQLAFGVAFLSSLTLAAVPNNDFVCAVTPTNSSMVYTCYQVDLDASSGIVNTPSVVNLSIPFVSNISSYDAVAAPNDAFFIAAVTLKTKGLYALLFNANNTTYVSLPVQNLVGVDSRVVVGSTFLCFLYLIDANPLNLTEVMYLQISCFSRGSLLIANVSFEGLLGNRYAGYPSLDVVASTTSPILCFAFASTNHTSFGCLNVSIPYFTSRYDVASALGAPKLVMQPGGALVGLHAPVATSGFTPPAIFHYWFDLSVSAARLFAYHSLDQSTFYSLSVTVSPAGDMACSVACGESFCYHGCRNLTNIGSLNLVSTIINTTQNITATSIIVLPDRTRYCFSRTDVSGISIVECIFNGVAYSSRTAILSPHVAQHKLIDGGSNNAGEISLGTVSGNNSFHFLEPNGVRIDYVSFSFAGGLTCADAVIHSSSAGDIVPFFYLSSFLHLMSHRINEKILMSVLCRCAKVAS